MEIRATNLKDKQKVVITPFKTQELGVIKLGIDAPKQVMVNRQEIDLQKLATKKGAKT